MIIYRISNPRSMWQSKQLLHSIYYWVHNCHDKVKKKETKKKLMEKAIDCCEQKLTQLHLFTFWSGCSLHFYFRSFRYVVSVFMIMSCINFINNSTFITLVWLNAKYSNRKRNEKKKNNSEPFIWSLFICMVAIAWIFLSLDCRLILPTKTNCVCVCARYTLRWKGNSFYTISTLTMTVILIAVPDHYLSFTIMSTRYPASGYKKFKSH